MAFLFEGHVIPYAIGITGIIFLALSIKSHETMAAAKTKTRRPPGKTAKKQPKKTPRKWSARVTRTSDALDLQPNVFKSTDPDKIAKSLKRSAEKSKRKKGTPLQSAMSMLNFYINRAGKNLSVHQKSILNKAKRKLRELFGRPAEHK